MIIVACIKSEDVVNLQLGLNENLKILVWMII